MRCSRAEQQNDGISHGFRSHVKRYDALVDQCAQMLVEAGHMAIEDLRKEQRDPLAELLQEISVRLGTASVEIRAEVQAAA